MNTKDLIPMAKHLLDIYEFMDMISSSVVNGNMFKISIFNQIWGNTSGGFEGMGGCAMTTQPTYVLYNHLWIYVFFNGEFAYYVDFCKITDEYEKIILDDLKNNRIAGKQSYIKKYGITNA